MKTTLLRLLLVLDAAVLLLLGACFIAAPGWALQMFGFPGLPASAHYIVGLYGCVYATLAAGYVIAAQDPPRHVAWIQIGIARGALECLFGIVSVAVGTVGWREAGVGTVTAGAVAVAYAVLYPRPTQEVQPLAGTQGEAP